MREKSRWREVALPDMHAHAAQPQKCNGVFGSTGLQALYSPARPRPPFDSRYYPFGYSWSLKKSSFVRPLMREVETGSAKSEARSAPFYLLLQLESMLLPLETGMSIGPMYAGVGLRKDRICSFEQ
jgi:hypothetical protein